MSYGRNFKVKGTLSVQYLDKILRGKNTKLVLYVYDSFLLDFDEGEEEILEEIKGVFDKNKLQTKTKTGVNYNFS